MGSRQSVCVLLGAALICAVSVFLVLQQINHTRIQLQRSGPGPFNYLWQADRSLDRLAETLFDYLEAKDSATREHLWAGAQQRFNLVWSTFNVLKIQDPGFDRQLASGIELIHEGKKFLTEFDPVFSVQQLPETQYLRASLTDLDELQSQLHRVGLQLYHRSTGFHDEVSQRMDKLYPYLWVSSVLLLLTGSGLIVQMFRLIRRSTQLFREARSSQEQLETVVDELRSGKLEKKAKDSFLAAASHDLRQPLHALGLFVNALENKVVIPDGPIILDKIKQSTEALSSLFNSLLDISRLDAGVVEVVSEHYDIGELLDQINEEFKEIAGARNLSFTVSHTNNIVYTDPVLIGRILRNLVDNAIVHTQAGHVAISCVPHNQLLKIEVADTGPGIPEEEQASVFSEYYQLNNPERDRSKGLGLGLSIVKRLSELLDVDLSLTSSRGSGTTFRLMVRGGEMSRVRQQTGIRDGDSKRVDFHGAVVVVIDDEQHVREGMELMLNQANCYVVSGESGEAVRDMIVEGNIVPSLIIADYRLREGKTGMEAIQLVREELNDDIPALIITGDTSPERVREVAVSGMNLLHKPVKPNELVSCVKRLIGGNEHYLVRVS